MPSQFDTEALAGQTFYRAAAAPSAAGEFAYAGLVNPAGSLVNAFLDAYELWPGLPGPAAELGILRWGEPFTGAAVIPIPSTNITLGTNAKSKMWLAAFPSLVNNFIDYVPTGPNNATPSTLTYLPYPIIIGPGHGIAFWNPTRGYELKVGLWIRELPQQ